MFCFFFNVELKFECQKGKKISIFHTTKSLSHRLEPDIKYTIQNFLINERINFW